MLKNSVYAKSIISFICVTFVISIFLFLGANAKTDANARIEKSKYDDYKETKDTVGDIKDKIGEYEDTLGQYFTIQNGIVNMLADNKEDMRDNVLSASSFEAALSGLAMQSADVLDGVTLKKQLDKVNTDMEKFVQDNIVKIYERKGNQNTNTMMGYNEAFSQLVTQYNDLNAEYTLRANKAIFGAATATSDKADLYQTDLYKAMPTAKSVFVTKCPNPSGNCYGYYKDVNKDKRTCLEKHGTSGLSNIVYWECENDDKTCHRAEEHWNLCPGICGEKFPPKKESEGRGAFSWVVDYPHQVKCNEDVYDGFWKFWAKCYGTYGESSIWYTCERSSCPNSGLHDDGNSNSYYNEDGSGSTSDNTPSTPSTTSYHTCGVHETTVSGDHSMQASCSLHTSGGQSCSVTNFYACDNHDPSATCAAGHTYDPTDDRLVNQHRTRTCRYCSQTWEVCGSGRPSVCNDPKRVKNGKGCWAEDF